MGLQKPPGLTLRGETWHFDKDIYGTRICESTGTSDLREAVEILSRRIEEVRARRFFGARKARTFRDVAMRFLEENQHSAEKVCDLASRKSPALSIGGRRDACKWLKSSWKGRART